MVSNVDLRSNKAKPVLHTMNLRNGSSRLRRDSNDINLEPESNNLETESYNLAKVPVKRNSTRVKTLQQKTINDQQLKVDQRNEIDAGEMFGRAMHEIVDLRKAFVNLQTTVGKSIDSMHEMINSKSQNFVAVTNSLQSEINAIRNILKINGDVIRSTYVPTMDTRFGYILQGNALKHLGLEYEAHVKRLNDKVIEIEQSNVQTVETVNDLIASISAFMGKDLNEIQRNSGTNDKIGDIENSIECIQHEINRVKTASFADSEKMMKMNKQVHVLTAKYIDFNVKIHRHLLDYNRKNANKIGAREIIDDDAKPYMLLGDDNDVTERVIVKSAVKKPMSTHRFVRPFNDSDYTRCIRVDIKHENIDDLERFKSNFASEFEQCIGKNTVKRILVTKYHLKEGAIDFISCIVEFMIPLNYEYINNHKFPINWDFLPINKQQYASRAMMSSMSQRT